MLREVPFSIEGIGLVPEGFYRDAEAALALIPDEWESVTVSPQFERDENGALTAYLGAGWHFRMGDKYAAFITEHPALMMDDGLRNRYLDMVRRAFEKATV